MFHLLAFCVLFLSAVVASGNDQAADNSPPQCNVNNYNNFYAGPNKKVEKLLTDMKKQLDAIQRQVELLTKSNSTNDNNTKVHRGSVCPKSWVRYGNSCFIITSNKISNWSDARKTCQNLGGDLATIKSAEENAFIFNLLSKQRRVSHYGAWLGLHRKADNKFYWIDDTPLEGQYSAWKTGEPNNHLGGPEDCGHMLGTGMWNDLYCNLEIHEFWRNYPYNIPLGLCQKKSN